MMKAPLLVTTPTMTTQTVINVNTTLSQKNDDSGDDAVVDAINDDADDYTDDDADDHDDDERD